MLPPAKGETTQIKNLASILVNLHFTSLFYNKQFGNALELNYFL